MQILTTILPFKLAKPELPSYFALCEADFAELQRNIHTYLSSQELAKYYTFSSELRAHSYLLGRRCAKELLVKFFSLNSNTMTIENSVFGHPIIMDNNLNYSLSLSHCGNTAVALMFPNSHPMGVDIESISPDKDDILLEYLTPSEIELIKSHIAGELMPLIFWSAREALAKILLCGISVPKDILAIKNVELHEDIYCVYFKNFFQIKAYIKVLAGKYILSLALPANVELSSSETIFNILTTHQYCT
jgi:phosphopantetheinyl transferase